MIIPQKKINLKIMMNISTSVFWKLFFLIEKCYGCYQPKGPFHYEVILFTLFFKNWQSSICPYGEKRVKNGLFFTSKSPKWRKIMLFDKKIFFSKLWILFSYQKKYWGEKSIFRRMQRQNLWHRPKRLKKCFFFSRPVKKGLIMYFLQIILCVI